jgi:hypothetical protein
MKYGYKLTFLTEKAKKDKKLDFTLVRSMYSNKCAAEAAWSGLVASEIIDTNGKYIGGA